MRVDPRNNAVREVGTIKVSHQSQRLAQSQLRYDVVADALCSRRRKGVESGFGEARLELGELSVFWAEVMAPVADAMRFIDGKVPNSGPFDPRQKTRRQQSLGGDEHQAVPSFRQTELGGPQDRQVQTAVQRGSRIPRRAETVHLIFHQRNQRRDHHIRPFADHRWHLVAE